MVSALALHQLMVGQWWDGLVGVFTASSAVPDPVASMDAAAATPAGVGYKQRLLAALQLRAGQVAVDIGCGPGTDLGALAAGVGRHGTVIGVDRQPRMIGEACRRSAARLNVRCCVADTTSCRCPAASIGLVPTGCCSRCAIRPRRSGRCAGSFDPAACSGWPSPTGTRSRSPMRMWTPAAGSLDSWPAGFNARIGRDLARRCVDAGLRVRSVQSIAVLLRDFGTADQILGLQRNTARAVLAGAIPRGTRPGMARAWLTRLAHGTLAAAFTAYRVIVTALVGIAAMAITTMTSLALARRHSSETNP